MSSAISPAWTKSPHRLSKGQGATGVSVKNKAPTINSPLLFKMLESLSKHKKYNILDISQANNNSLEFFSDYWCKLFINNAINSINKLDKNDINTSHKWHRALVKIMGLHKKSNAELDIIFLWDLPNYLEPEKLKGFIDYILPQCTKNTCLHTYVFNSEFISETPSNYQILSNQKVAISPPQRTNKVNGPMYNVNALKKMLAPFNLDQSVMLSSGVQEYIFRLS